MCIYILRQEKGECMSQLKKKINFMSPLFNVSPLFHVKLTVTDIYNVHCRSKNWKTVHNNSDSQN